MQASFPPTLAVAVQKPTVIPTSGLHDKEQRLVGRQISVVDSKAIQADALSLLFPLPQGPQVCSLHHTAPGQLGGVAEPPLLQRQVSRNISLRRCKRCAVLPTQEALQTCCLCSTRGCTLRFSGLERTRSPVPPYWLADLSSDGCLTSTCSTPSGRILGQALRMPPAASTLLWPRSSPSRSSKPPNNVFIPYSTMISCLRPKP